MVMAGVIFTPILASKPNLLEKEINKNSESYPPNVQSWAKFFVFT
jgi:hypothetical protein